MRWRLVGADGHPVSERVTFTIQSPAPTTAAAAAVTTVPAPGAPAGPVPTTTTAAPPPTSHLTPTIGRAATPELACAPLRGLSYVAILVAAGVVLTHLGVSRAGDGPPPRDAPGRIRDRRHRRHGFAAAGRDRFTSAVAPRGIRSPRFSSSGRVHRRRRGLDGAHRLVRRRAASLLVHAPPRVVHVRNELLLMISSSSWPPGPLPATPVRCAGQRLASHSTCPSRRRRCVARRPDHRGVCALPALRPEDVRPVMRRFAARHRGGQRHRRDRSGAVGAVGGRTGSVARRETRPVAGGQGSGADSDARVGRPQSAPAGCPAEYGGEPPLRSMWPRLRRGMVAELAIGLVIIGITAAMVVSPPATSAAAALTPLTHV